MLSIVGVHRRFERMGLRVEHEVVAIGRALAVTVYASECPIVHMVGVHIDPSLDAHRQLGMFCRIAAAGSRHLAALSVLGVDWNCMKRDEERFRSDGIDRRDTHLAADRFDAVMQDYTEAYQPHFTYRRRGLAGQDTYSRIDRWYMLHDAVAERCMSYIAGLFCSFVSGRCPSDHLPITLTVTIADVGPSRRRRPYASVVRTEVYQSTLQRNLEMLSLTCSAARRLGASISAAHSAATVANSAFLRDQDAGPWLTVEAELRCATLARCGSDGEACELCDAVPRLARTALRDEIDVAGLARLYAKNMDTAILADLASLERSPVPDPHKRARMTQLRKHHDAILAGRRWGTLYREDQAPCLTHTDVGATYWGPVFDARPHDCASAARFLPFAQDLGIARRTGDGPPGRFGG